jgi:hypothetical protein
VIPHPPVAVLGKGLKIHMRLVEIFLSRWAEALIHHSCWQVVHPLTPSYYPQYWFYQLLPYIAGAIDKISTPSYANQWSKIDVFLQYFCAASNAIEAKCIVTVTSHLRVYGTGTRA